MNSFGHTAFPGNQADALLQSSLLGPHGFYWLALRPGARHRRRWKPAWAPPELNLPAAWNGALLRSASSARCCRLCADTPVVWQQGAHSPRTEDRPECGHEAGMVRPLGFLVIEESAFTDGLPESYLLPIWLWPDESDHRASPRRGAARRRRASRRPAIRSAMPCTAS